MVLLSESGVDLSHINITYYFMDYDQEYWDDLGRIMAGEMNQQEYEKKYGNVKELKFELSQK